MRESRKNNKGFSLVEMLVAISILVVVVAPLTKILISSSKVNQKTKRVMSATEMAQNIFEGISSKRPEDAIIELSALVKTDDPVLDKPVSLIPGGMTYDRIGEYMAVVDPSTGAVNQDANASTGGQFIQSIVQDASSGKFRCKGFKESADGVYEFWIQGLRQSDTYYDLKIRFDASSFEADYAPDPSDPLHETDYVSIPTISNVNGAYDGMFMESPLALSNVLSGEYRGNQIVAGFSEAQILEDLKRTYTIDVKNIGTVDAPQIVVDLVVHYNYQATSNLAIGSSGEYTSSVERIFDSSDYNTTPRNLFLYYTPNYNSTSLGDAALDQFVINNLDDYDINVYIVRMEQAGAEAQALNNESTFATNEEDYTASVSINEGETKAYSSGGSSIELNTVIRTNLDKNILKADTISNYKTDKDKEDGYITYTVNGLSETEVKDNLKVKGLDAQDEEKRVYNVTIDVYMGKSSGMKHDNNANSSYEGAFANDFPEKAKLAAFTGKVVQ